MDETVKYTTNTYKDTQILVTQTDNVIDEINRLDQHSFDNLDSVKDIHKKADELFATAQTLNRNINEFKTK